MYEKNNRPVVATDDDYKQGRHYGWEVAAHETEEEAFKKTGKRWDFDYRRQWLLRYFTITPYHEAYTVRPCSVCQESISKAMLEARNPWQPPDSFKEELNKLTRRLGNVIGVRKSRIRTI